ncbi:MAG: DUF1573 domain-containing protein [Clostridia bacterium]|nr:MAG: DUF1573 domain-containing protein [Clostridia bacterium]
MAYLTCDEFQKAVAQYTIRHKSILDIMSKAQDANARLNRAVTKAATTCGCIRIETIKKPIPEDASLEDLSDLLDNHLRGSLCEDCRDMVENEMGKLLFYLAALCNTVGLDLNSVMAKEDNQLKTLRVFNLT